MKQIRTYLVILAAIALLSIVIDLNEESFTSYTFDVLKFPRLTGASPFDQPAQISQISITNCTNISNSGDFVLTTDILNNDSARCIDIDAADVYLNCNNRTVDGIYNGTTYGIYLISTNVTVKDCNVTDWGIGIYLSDADNSFILDNRINNSNGTGISTGLADNNTLKNNLISNSYDTSASFSDSRSQPIIAQSDQDSKTSIESPYIRSGKGGIIFLRRRTVEGQLVMPDGEGGYC